MPTCLLVGQAFMLLQVGGLGSTACNVVWWQTQPQHIIVADSEMVAHAMCCPSYKEVHLYRSVPTSISKSTVCPSNETHLVPLVRKMHHFCHRPKPHQPLLACGAQPLALTPTLEGCANADALALLGWRCMHLHTNVCV